MMMPPTPSTVSPGEPVVLGVVGSHGPATLRAVRMPKIVIVSGHVGFGKQTSAAAGAAFTMSRAMAVPRVMLSNLFMMGTPGWGRSTMLWNLGSKGKSGRHLPAPWRVDFEWWTGQDLSTGLGLCSKRYHDQKRSRK